MKIRRIGIIQKSWALVGVPLCFAVAFSVVLIIQLAEFNRIIQHQLTLTNAMIALDIATRRIFIARISALSYFTKKDDWFEKTYFTKMKDAVTAMSHLKKYLKNEKQLKTLLAELEQEVFISNHGYVLIMHYPLDLRF